MIACGLLSDACMKECALIVSKYVYMLGTYILSVSCLFYVSNRIKTHVSMFM